MGKESSYHQQTQRNTKEDYRQQVRLKERKKQQSNGQAIESKSEERISSTLSIELHKAHFTATDVRVFSRMYDLDESEAASTLLSLGISSEEILSASLIPIEGPNGDTEFMRIPRSQAAFTVLSERYMPPTGFYYKKLEREQRRANRGRK